jgi:3-hydroxyisobutyrate dehydrogenase-like beta-hydroxyacid dehydrogenase
MFGGLVGDRRMETGVKAAFLGLGVMGYPMAGHLAKAGHQVVVYNRTRAKAAAWVNEYGGSFCDSPAAAAADADVVFSCVGNDDDVRAILSSADGAFAGMKKGAVLADHTTASAEVAREMATIGERKGLGFLDAPVSGGQAGAVNGKLTVMVGGDPAAFKLAAPLMQCYGRAVTLMGPVGSSSVQRAARRRPRRSRHDTR